MHAHAHARTCARGEVRVHKRCACNGVLPAQNTRTMRRLDSCSSRFFLPMATACSSRLRRDSASSTVFLYNTRRPAKASPLPSVPAPLSPGADMMGMKRHRSFANARCLHTRERTQPRTVSCMRNAAQEAQPSASASGGRDAESRRVAALCTRARARARGCAMHGPRQRMYSRAGRARRARRTTLVLRPFPRRVPHMNRVARSESVHNPWHGLLDAPHTHVPLPLVYSAGNGARRQ